MTILWKKIQQTRNTKKKKMIDSAWENTQEKLY